MTARLATGLTLVILGLMVNEATALNSNEVHVARIKRDTSEWVRRSDSPFLQDFRNGTSNNATSSVWKKCSCDFNACDCYAEYSDFNSSRLTFRIEHVADYTRFKISFKNQDKSVSQQFVLHNGTTCYQFRGANFDQVCFLRYGSENNTVLDKACFALGVRLYRYSAISADFECIKWMSDGTTHVGPLNISSPDLNSMVNYTLYGSAASNSTCILLLLVSVTIALLISKYEV